MKINPISFQYNFTKPQKKNSNVASNSILMQSKSENITKYPVAFGSLIQFLDLKNAGYNVANVENNRLSNNEDKILINSAESFLALANSPNIWNKKIVLANDIDLNGKEIKPIGSAKAPFRGEFDGNGCKITNFKIDSPEGRNIGLFGKCENAKISNLEIEKAFIRGNEQIGGFAGFASNSELNNCHFQGYISGNKFIGGLIGIGNKNTVKNSSSECNIIAEEENNFSPFDIETDVNKTESIGGFIGSDYESTINSSYSKSKINGDEQVGGFIGYAKNSEINNCAFDGIINADAKSGSMIGWGENSVINTSYSLSNQKKHIGYGLNNSTSGVCNDIDDLMSGYGCWNSDIWIKDYDKIPRLRIQEDRMSTQKLFFDDVNKDIDAERITDPFDELDAENVLEDIQLNIFPPKHFPSNDELLNKIRNCNDPEVLFESFNNFILNDRYITRPSMEIKDEYKEILLEFVKNPKMDLNRRSEYGYSIWCTPLFIMTTINEPYALQEALKRDDIDLMAKSGSDRSKTVLSRVFNNHIDPCVYVLLTSQSPKVKEIIDSQIDNFKAWDISPLTRLLLECYPDLPKYDSETGTITFSQEVNIPEELKKSSNKILRLQDIQSKFFIDQNYRDSRGNNIANVLTTLDDEREALSILLRAEKNGTDLNNRNNKYETPIGNALYRKMPHIVARLLPQSDIPFVRVNDGTDAMLLFSEINNDTMSTNYIEIAKEKGLSVNTHDDNGNTPIINATRQRNINTVKYLLSQGANPDIADNSGQTALHNACINNDIELITLLLDNYAYPKIKDAFGNLPFNYLDDETKQKMSSTFEESIALFDTSDINDEIFDNSTGTNVDNFEEIRSLDKISKLIENGENADKEILMLTKNIILNPKIVKKQNKDGDSLLHIISKSRSKYAGECIKAALDSGANVNSQNNNMETPLVSAANEYLCAISAKDKINLLRNIKILLSANPNVDITDTTKQSVLHKICQSGNMILFNEILKLNPKINQVDIYGNVPFKYMPQKADAAMSYIAETYLKNYEILKETK